MLGVLLPYTLHSEVVDHEGERNGAGGVFPETWVLFVKGDVCLYLFGRQDRSERRIVI